MPSFRTVRDLSDFAFPGDPPEYADAVSQLWRAGAGRPDWCFVLDTDGQRRGRIGVRVAPTTSDPAWLGSLPPHELFAYGLEVPWGDVELGRRLLAFAASRVGDQVPAELEIRFNVADHQNAATRAAWAESAGLTLFQEKLGFTWNDDGPVTVPDRLEFVTVADVGRDVYRQVMAVSGRGTLDRNDRYYWNGCGAQNWASQMMVYLDEADASMWLLGLRNGEPIGYVAVVRDPVLEATIAHIGVLPQHRGNGYVHDLLVAGTAAAQRQGIRSMLSDVDTLNRPMIEAMRRCGHRDGIDPWHLWVYRARLSDLAA